MPISSLMCRNAAREELTTKGNSIGRYVSNYKETPAPWSALTGDALPKNAIRLLHLVISSFERTLHLPTSPSITSTLNRTC